MSLKKIVNLRLTVEEKQNYEQEAKQAGLGLATYLRQLLAERHQMELRIQEELSRMRRLMQHNHELLQEKSTDNTLVGTDKQVLPSSIRLATSEQAPQAEADAGLEIIDLQSVCLEMLLLLRQIGQVGKVRLAQEELKRLGYEVWQGEEAS